MALKEFKFKSFTLDQLKELGTPAFMELLPSRQRRSFKRGFGEQKEKLIKKIEKKNNVKTHVRDMVILPNMIGKTVQIYTGKEFQAVTFTEDMLGHYFGEYALTRKKATHTNIGVTNKPKK